MGDADKKLTIQIEAKGAKPAAAEMASVAKATEQIGDASKIDALLAKLAAGLDQVSQEMGQVQATTPAATGGIEAFTKELTDAEAQVSRARDVLKRYEAAHGPLRKSHANGGLAVLEFSRALEDAQYGIRGVLNNIPNLVMMLGMSGGVAGVVSIAAVAMTTLLPLLHELATATTDIELGELPELARISGEAATAADDAARAQAAHNRSIEEGAAMVAAYEKALQDLAARTAAREDAVLGEALARIDLEELRGNLSAAEALVQRYEAQRAADTRKRAMEEEALIRTRDARAAQLPGASADYRAAVEAENRARSAAGAVAGSRPGDIRELADQVFARDQAQRGLGRATTEEERAAAEAEVAKANADLKQAYDELLEARLEEYEAATAARIAAQNRAKELAAGVDAAGRDLTRFRTEGAEIRGAQDRTAALRLQAEQERQRQAAAANQTAVPAELLAAIAGSQAMDAAGNQPLANSLTALASLLQNGTSSTELVQAAELLDAAVAAVETSDRGAKARLAQVEARLQALQEQVANGRSFE